MLEANRKKVIGFHDEFFTFFISGFNRDLFVSVNKFINTGNAKAALL